MASAITAGERKAARSRSRTEVDVKFISAILAAGVAALLAAAPVSASAATAAHAAARSTQVYCVTEIARIHPGQAASRIVLDKCSTRHAPGSDLPAGVNVTGETLLVRFYEDVNYKGRHDTISGADGPCDTIGYQFPNTVAKNNKIGGISSYKLYNKCQFASYWTRTGFRGLKNPAVPGNNRYVGANWNDHIYSMRTWA
jgi:hypothetical protein